MQALLARHGKALFGVEQRRPLRDFHCLVRCAGHAHDATHRPCCIPGMENVRALRAAPFRQCSATSAPRHCLVRDAPAVTSAGRPAPKWLHSCRQPGAASAALNPLPHAHTLQGFSLAYELGCTNILEMLKLGGVPVSWEVSG
jgi:hypothetical protein